MSKNKLFVGNLTYSVRKSQLIELFSKYGDVISANVLENRGYGFVEMANAQQADKARDALNEKEFCGRNLLIDGVRPFHPAKRRSQKPTGGGGKGRGQGRPETDERNRSQRSSGPAGKRGGQPSSRRSSENSGSRRPKGTSTHPSSSRGGEKGSRKSWGDNQKNISGKSSRSESRPGQNKSGQSSGKANDEVTRKYWPMPGQKSKKRSY